MSLTGKTQENINSILTQIDPDYGNKGTSGLPEAQKAILKNSVLSNTLIQLSSSLLDWFINDTVEGRKFRNRMLILTIRRHGFIVWLIVFLMAYGLISLIKKII